jgi:hypothetical protein
MPVKIRDPKTTGLRSPVVTQPKRKAVAPPPPARIDRKPMARVTKVTLFEREVRERLSNAALELLLGRAQVLAEGRRADSPTARKAFFGSIMITMDLAALDGDVRDPLTDHTAARIAERMESDPRVTRWLRKLAENEASRLAGAPIRVHSADVRIRCEGARVLVDIDVEE